MDEFSIAAKIARIKYECRQQIVLTVKDMEKIQDMDLSSLVGGDIIFDDLDTPIYPVDGLNYTTEIIEMENQNEMTIDEITAPYSDFTYNATFFQHCIECDKSTFDFSSGSTCLCNYEKVVLGVMYLFTIFYLIGFMMNAALVWGLSRGGTIEYEICTVFFENKFIEYREWNIVFCFRQQGSIGYKSDLKISLS